MSTATNILAVLLIFLSGVLLGYSISNYQNHQRLDDRLFPVFILMDLKVNYPEVINEIQKKEYVKDWLNRNKED